MVSGVTCTAKHKGLWCTLNDEHRGLHYDASEKAYFENSAYPLEWVPDRWMLYYRAIDEERKEKGRGLRFDESFAIWDRISKVEL